MSATAQQVTIRDPDDVWPVGWDWADVLALVDGQIAAHQIVADPGITVVSSGVDGALVTAVLSGGTAGESYRVVCRITLTTGPPFQRNETRTVVVRKK